MKNITMHEKTGTDTYEVLNPSTSFTNNENWSSYSLTVANEGKLLLSSLDGRDFQFYYDNGTTLWNFGTCHIWDTSGTEYLGHCGTNAFDDASERWLIADGSPIHYIAVYDENGRMTSGTLLYRKII